MIFRKNPLDVTLWHKWHVFLPVRTITGTWTIADVWRKRHCGKWIHQPRPMSEEERSDLTAI